MANEKLDNLVNIGKLKAEDSTDEEVDGLIRSGLVRLADSRNKTLNIDITMRDGSPRYDHFL